MVKIQGFVSVDEHGRKSYNKPMTRYWVVEDQGFSMDFIKQSLSAEMKCGLNQTVVVWYFDKIWGEDTKLVDDSQIVGLLDMYRPENKLDLVVGVFDKEEVAKEDQVLFEPFYPIPLVMIPNSQTPPEEPTNRNPTDTCPPGQTTFAANVAVSKEPAANVAVSKEPAAKEADAVEPDVFDSTEEYVGVDDEGLYGPPSHDDPAHSEHADPSHDDHADPAPFEAEGDVPPEAEINDVDPEEVNVVHDPENPNIVQGALFPDIVTFRKAIRHYAIKMGFEFNGLKTDQTRFIAHCSYEGCPWRIHASRIQDERTIQVC